MKKTMPSFAMMVTKTMMMENNNDTCESSLFERWSENEKDGQKIITMFRKDMQVWTKVPARRWCPVSVQRRLLFTVICIFLDFLLTGNQQGFEAEN